MVSLPGISIREALGIDTLERACAFAAMVMKATIDDKDNPQAIWVPERYQGAIQAGALDRRLMISVALHFDPVRSMRLGGNFIDTIHEFSTVDPIILFDPLPPTPDNTLPLPATPNYVDSLEKYFAWASSTLLLYNTKIIPEHNLQTLKWVWASGQPVGMIGDYPVQVLLDYLDEQGNPFLVPETIESKYKNLSVEHAFNLGEEPYPHVMVNLALPYNQDKLLEHGSMLAALKQIVKDSF
jgi:hypothetical protein